QSLWSPPNTLAALIIQDIRLPRTILALITGAVLGLSGAVLQGFTRNSLAEPALLGVSSGAALGAVIAIYFGLATISAFIGPLLALTGRALDALSLGEIQAESLGFDLTNLAALVVAGTALSVGAITSVTGAIGFIGLVAPHLVRPLVGYEPRRVLLPAALAGA